MDPADEDKFDFDPLDVTKVWPEHLFPLQPVGRMVLNKNREAPPWVSYLTPLLALASVGTITFAATVPNLTALPDRGSHRRTVPKPQHRHARLWDTAFTTVPFLSSL